MPAEHEDIARWIGLLGSPSPSVRRAAYARLVDAFETEELMCDCKASTVEEPCPTHEMEATYECPNQFFMRFFRALDAAQDPEVIRLLKSIVTMRGRLDDAGEIECAELLNVDCVRLECPEHLYKRVWCSKPSWGRDGRVTGACFAKDACARRWDGKSDTEAPVVEAGSGGSGHTRDLERASCPGAGTLRVCKTSVPMFTGYLSKAIDEVDEWTKQEVDDFRKYFECDDPCTLIPGQQRVSIEIDADSGEVTVCRTMDYLCLKNVYEGDWLTSLTSVSDSWLSISGLGAALRAERRADGHAVVLAPVSRPAGFADDKAQRIDSQARDGPEVRSELTRGREALD